MDTRIILLYSPIYCSTAHTISTACKFKFRKENSNRAVFGGLFAGFLNLKTISLNPRCSATRGDAAPHDHRTASKPLISRCFSQIH